MDTIDVVGARELLQRVSEEAAINLTLASLSPAQVCQWEPNVKVSRVDFPTTWRLLHGEGESQEELVFSVRGVLIAKDLPPVIQRPRLTPGRFKYLRQGITISGLDTPTFNQAIAVANEIYGLFDRNFPDGQMESWTPSGIPGPNNSTGLDCSNRYMIPKRDAPDNRHVAFSALVDPKGILEDMAQTSSHIHTEENEVVYFSSRTDVPGTRRFVPTTPQSFRIGDVVEIQVSFVVVPLKGEQYKMVTVLRSIALLDSTFGQSAAKTKVMARTAQAIMKSSLSVKRRVGYTLEAKDEESEPKKGRVDTDDNMSERLASNFDAHV